MYAKLHKIFLFLYIAVYICGKMISIVNDYFAIFLDYLQKTVYSYCNYHVIFFILYRAFQIINLQILVLKITCIANR